ncbi:MarR family transcriptional regulator [Halomarina pelagica]|uniref:MarR family transcriptional regulator n=1 Tax=Halomarina pelagica TaxID=2961599 RepID=UPI0020C3C662|nr:helix-turn-helix domain-containing protein [Halomarina sp. BND7]
MPVRFDDYEEQADELNWTPTEESNPHKILTFLLGHPDVGFTPSEIAEATGIPKGSVGPTLQRLHERGLVRHKEPYWAIGEDDRIAAYQGMLLSMEALRDRYGDDGWSDVDPEEHEADEAELEEWRRERRAEG